MEGEIWLRDATIEITSGATGQFTLTAEPAHTVPLTFTNPGNGQITVETRNESGRIASFTRLGLDTKKGKSSLQIALPTGRFLVTVRTIEGLSGSVDVDVEDSRKPRPPVDIPLH
jgi:hypothetical protein